MAKWIILTGGGSSVIRRFEGTRAQVVKYCKDHYLPRGYKIVKDEVA